MKRLKEFLGGLLASSIIAAMMAWLFIAWVEKSAQERERIVEAHIADTTR